MLKKSVEIEYGENADYVLKMLSLTLQSVRAAYRTINTPDIMTYFCAVPCASFQGPLAGAANVLANGVFAVLTVAKLAKDSTSFIVVYKPKNEAVACVALQPEGALSETGCASVVHLSVAAFKEHRGKWNARAAIRTAIETVLNENRSIENVDALVLPENKPSQKVLERAGFVKKEIVSAPAQWFRQKDRKDVGLWRLPRQGVFGMKR